MNRERQRRVAVVTPWYPDPQSPYRGVFVRAMVEAVAPGCAEVTVYHLNGWPVGPSGRAERDERLWRLHERLVPRSTPPVRTAGGAVLRRVPAIVPRTRDWRTHSDEYAHWLGVALGGEPIDAPIIHTHVPINAAWAALEHRRPGARVYTTEHSSFLDSVLEQPAARDRYDEILDRVDGFFVVGEPLHDLITETFPHHAAKVEYIANPIDFRAEPKEPPAGLRRWLSVAALNERKRIGYLLEGFARCRSVHPELTLTLAGDGELRAELARRSAELGLDDAVSFLGSVEPAEVPGLMAAHDLLVHTSRHETFGVVVVEASAAGIPVLATRSGGPDQVLAGVEADAGALIDVDDDPEVLVAGFERLRARYPERVDLRRSREALRASYSYESVAARHYEVWDRVGPDGGQG